ncbi:hypothetical protein B0J14DRAFT_677964 [Halenospora varia]|nr:hypothetical protein B0J14DRAFT_677964 [Halenospora varia]
MVLADGRVVCASPDGVVRIDGENSVDDGGELFEGATGSMGTLGVGTLFEVEFLQVDRGRRGAFVELQYTSVGSVDDAIKIFRLGRAPEPKVVFMDAIMCSKSFGVVVLGRLSDGE